MILAREPLAKENAKTPQIMRIMPKINSIALT